MSDGKLLTAEPVLDTDEAYELLRKLISFGVKVGFDGERLSVAAPKGVMTKQMRDEITHSKQQLIDILTAQAAAGREDQDDLNVVPDPDVARAVFPMSDLQQGFHLGADPSMALHVRPHYYMEIDFEEFDLERYQAAWNHALARRSRSLCQMTAEGELQQIAQPFVPLEFRIHDLRDVDDAEERDRRLLQHRDAMERSELPLDHWPWCDWSVSLLPDNRARVHYNHNSFFSDGAGTQRLLQEVSRHYLSGQAVASPDPLSLSFADCVSALNRLAKSEKGERARQYWMARLDDLPPPPALPQNADFDFQQRSVLTRREFIMPSALWQRFVQSCAEFGVSASAALYAAYGEILAQWSGSRHFIINQMITRRILNHPDIMDVLGNFVSLYPLEFDLRAPRDFVHLAQRLNDRITSDMDHLEIGGMEVLAALNRQSGTPGSIPVPLVVASGLAMKGVIEADYSCLETPQVILDHQFWQTDDGALLVHWDVIEDAFPAGMVDAMWKSYHDLIARLSESMHAWQRPVGPLCPAEQIAERAVFNATDIALPNLDRPLWCPVFDHAQTRPDAVALVQDGQKISYGELVARATELAHRLVAKGLRPQECVAIELPKGVGQAIAVLGVLRAGGAYVPMAEEAPKARREDILKQAGCRFSIARQGVEAQRPNGAGIEFLSVPGASDTQGPLPTVPAVDADPHSRAYVLFTSGSTGVPKGVVMSHHAVANTINDINTRFGVSADDRVLAVSELTFDLSVYDIFGVMAAGGQVVFPDPGCTKDPQHWAELIASHKISLWNSAPALMELLSEDLTNDADLASLRLVMLSGDWVNPRLVARLRQQLRPKARIMSLGGATEAAIWSIIHDTDAQPEGWSKIPYGVPMYNQRWHVLDENLYPCPNDVGGALYIAGDGLALEYLNDTAKTEAAFISNPQTGERLYRTGDLGRFRDGLIEFLGRADTQIKIRGYRVEIGEIEAAILACDGVESCVVLPQDSGRSRHLVAFVTPADALESRADIDLALKERLPDYMRPDHWIGLEALPITSHGKVDRKSLSQQVDFQPETDVKAVPIESDLQRLIAEVWETHLDAPVPGITHDFFDLGGTSFTAIRVVSALNKRLDGAYAHLVLADLIRERSIAGLERHLFAGASSEHALLLNFSPRSPEFKTPTIWVHPAGGSALCYSGLAKRLRRPFFAVQSPGLSGPEAAKPYDSLADLVQAYADGIGETLPPGPVLLGGWSSGGVIAAALEPELRQRGYDIRALAVVDAPPATSGPAPERAILLRWFLEDLGARPVPSLEYCRSLCAQDDSTMLQRALENTNHGYDHGLLAVFHTFCATVHAVRTAVQPDIVADTLLLRATEGQVEEFSTHPDFAMSDWGWRSVCKSPVSLGSLPGPHIHLLEGEALTSLATQINAFFTRKDIET